jgi:hypothetical protein
MERIGFDMRMSFRNMTPARERKNEKKKKNDEENAK